MDARRGLAALLGRARSLRGPAARAAVDDRPRRSLPVIRRGLHSRLCRRPIADAAGLAPARQARPAPRRRAPQPASPPGLTLKPAPLEPTDLRFPINLATALRLSDARPLIVAAAQASVWVAEAELTRAKVLWVPTLNVGFDYIRHDGGGPDFNKGIMTAPSVNFFYGGAGLWGTLPTTDAIFEPLVARQVLNAAHWDIQSAKNDALLQTADAYFRVHQLSRDVRRRPLHRRARARPGRADRAAEQGAGPQGRGRPGPEHARRPRAAGRLGAPGVAGRRAPT